MSDSDEDEHVAAPSSKGAAVGPPKPPPGVVLKRVGRNKGKPVSPVAPAMPEAAPVPAAAAAPAEPRLTPAVAVAAMRGDPSKPPPVAESDSESDDDSDDLVCCDRAARFLLF